MTTRTLPSLVASALLVLFALGCERCGRVPPVNTTQPAAAATPAVAATPGADAGTSAQPLPSDPEACLDEVFRQAGLNQYGDPADTMYAGGSPLFNEATGVATPRREYAARKHPELVARCPLPPGK